MSLFSSSSSAKRFGVVIDIGSGSAMVALVVSEPGKQEPEVLWSKRENAPLKKVDNLHESSKLVMTALMNILLEFETVGRRVLQDYQPGASLSITQCSIAAPWAYTVTKRINYQQDEPFLVSQELIEELVNTAVTKTEVDLKEREVTAELGLEVASRATLHTNLNGYRTKNPTGQNVEKLTLLHTTVVTHEYLLKTLKDLHQKMFKGTTLEVFSYSLVLHCVANDIAPQHTNMCLIDVTHEATEMSIVRDSELTYVTHAPFGLYSLAREISNITKAPLAESLGYLDSPSNVFLKKLPEKQAEEVEIVLNSYIGKLTELFTETGDDLAVPRQLVLHTESNTEEFTTEMLQQVTKRSIKAEPVVIEATSLLFNRFNKSSKVALSDTALLVAAHFFHTGNKCMTIAHE